MSMLSKDKKMKLKKSRNVSKKMVQKRNCKKMRAVSGNVAPKDTGENGIGLRICRSSNVNQRNSKNKNELDDFNDKNLHEFWKGKSEKFLEDSCFSDRSKNENCKGKNALEDKNSSGVGNNDRLLLEKKDNNIVIDDLLIRKATQCIQKIIRRNSGSQPLQDLLNDANSPTISLMISLQRIFSTIKKKPIKIELKNSLLNDTSEVCLIVKDPQRKWKDIIRGKENLSRITKVISITKLMKKFPQFSDKRILCSAYDLFLCDDRIFDRVFNFLGRTFFQSKKMPIPVRLKTTNVDPTLTAALKSTFVFLPRGPSICIKVGRGNNEEEKITENIKKVITCMQTFFSQKNRWANEITNISLQATNTPSLPLYIHPKYHQAVKDFFHRKSLQTSRCNKSNFREIVVPDGEKARSSNSNIKNREKLMEKGTEGRDSSSVITKRKRDDNSDYAREKIRRNGNLHESVDVQENDYDHVLKGNIFSRENRKKDSACGSRNKKLKD